MLNEITGKVANLNIQTKINKQLDKINNFVCKCTITLQERHMCSECWIWGLTRHISFVMLGCISLTISAIDLPSVLGHTITLSCPVASPSNDLPRSIKEWFRGPIADPKTRVAILVINENNVEYNYTFDEKMRLGVHHGDSIITNLTLDDMGFYICHFTGSKEQTFQLYTRGMFHGFYWNGWVE